MVSHLRFHVHVNKESSETIIVANIYNRGERGGQWGLGLEEEENKGNSQHEM